MLGRIALVATMAFLSACAETEAVDCPPQEKDLAELKALLQLNPEELAKEEAKLSNPSFYGVHGYSVNTPGLTNDIMACLHQKAQIKHMPGTSDILCSDEIVNLQPAAKSFAERYNSELASSMELKCP
ncbi:MULTISPECIES: hypothetical protein [unclassified Pseudomonas]|uniref:hypothetical protein n=1 Tax=unclassified Pseudomonas TaxID=196821 RepID=UPI002448C47B|nr:MULTISPECIES: hypothetical protein [unclassified Pseudomonas]MDG9930435.1 hypothetical protein [Pseudomonas sp. GD04042]MDH0483015.1 hypothetical protein [Pseudomonas sp. GD04015]MDH0605415.1 hypothetical protein [Pseudomonas sp. GD03869]